MMAEMLCTIESELINWAVGGSTLLVIALAVIGLFAVIRVVSAYE